MGERSVIMLDTHALVWWVSNPATLPARAVRRLEESVAAGEPLHVSSISMWEIAMLVSRKRLQLRIPVADWLAAVEALPLLNIVPVDNRIAVRAVFLEDFRPRDPADRMIVATALNLGATLVTGDSRIRAYPAVKSLWR